MSSAGRGGEGEVPPKRQNGDKVIKRLDILCCIIIIVQQRGTIFFLCMSMCQLSTEVQSLCGGKKKKSFSVSEFIIISTQEENVKRSDDLVSGSNNQQMRSFFQFRPFVMNNEQGQEKGFNGRRRKMAHQVVSHDH
jgi:hypothetical protein